MIKQFVKFLKDEDGVTSVEYAVMAALIALVVELPYLVQVPNLVYS
jgi:Flp pilus assembly pilin Flp